LLTTTFFGNPGNIAPSSIRESLLEGYELGLDLPMRLGLEIIIGPELGRKLGTSLGPLEGESERNVAGTWVWTVVRTGKEKFDTNKRRCDSVLWTGDHQPETIINLKKGYKVLDNQPKDLSGAVALAR
jgi:hypothetical protein